MRLILLGIGFSLVATAAFAQNPVQTMSPTSAATTTNSYTQDLSDPTDPRATTGIGDPLRSRSRAAPVVIGVGGLVGLGEKDAPPTPRPEAARPSRRTR
jgi:hypothetical protein